MYMGKDGCSPQAMKEDSESTLLFGACLCNRLSAGTISPTRDREVQPSFDWYTCPQVISS